MYKVCATGHMRAINVCWCVNLQRLGGIVAGYKVACVILRKQSINS